MEKNFQDISLQEVQKLANSPAGRQLMALLQQNDSKQLALAADKMMAGDTGQAKQLLQPLLDSPEIAQLLKQLGG